MSKFKKRPAIPQLPPAIPGRFLARMRPLLGPDFPAFAAIYDQSPTHGLRVNTLKLTPEAFLAFSPFRLSPLPWNSSGFLLEEPEERPGKHPFHAAGLYYLQDPHAQAVAEILAPQPGERVLDLAAAPGGKTTHIASRMQNGGLLVANEIKTKRIGHLAANLERWGARNVTVLNETPERLADFFGPFFDRVLVDAPCSGEGMFRKDLSARSDWSEDMVAGCAVRQAAILHYASRLVRPGGWLCYSTCTFAPEENEEVIDAFLSAHPDFAVAHETYPVTSDALCATRCGFRLWPHTSPGEGHFIALLHRREDAPPGRPAGAGQPAPLGRILQAQWRTWCEEHLAALPDVTPVQVGTRLYALPDGLPDLGGLRVLHPGWWLGDFKKDRFEPAHALAMALHVEDARCILALPADDPGVIKYLRGETLVSAGDPGWMLVGVTVPASFPGAPEAQAFPLGWGKRVQGVVKNHYPRGLAWLGPGP
ncbi:MAG: RsmB/NOP family class I SAM-dependent RNA methyltransferase [Chloroflexota bacterium]